MEWLGLTGSSKPSSMHDLPDTVLVKIFGYLEPKDRFLVRLVCQQWCKITRMNWNDIRHLDLTPIPPESIGSIICLSPKVQSITGRNLFLALKKLRAMKDRCVTSVKFYSVIFPINDLDTVDEEYRDEFLESLRTFFERLPQLAELVWHHVVTKCARSPASKSFMFRAPISLGWSLARLQLSGAGCVIKRTDFVESMPRLWNLECLILAGNLKFSGLSTEDFCDLIAMKKHLRELCIADLQFTSPNEVLTCHDLATVICEKLRKLEVLCLALADKAYCTESLTMLTTTHPTLRIFMFSGYFPETDEDDDDDEDILLPIRRRFRPGIPDPLPLLHIFVGGLILDFVRFVKSSLAIVQPISEPAPQFLRKPEIAAIFKESWIAQMICECAEKAIRLWDYTNFSGDKMVTYMAPDDAHHT